MQPHHRHGNTHPEDSPIFPVEPSTWQDVLAYYQFAPQQHRVVELILCGHTYEAVAQELELGQATIRTYLARVCQKVGVTNRNELILALATKAVELASQHKQDGITGDDNASDDATSADKTSCP